MSEANRWNLYGIDTAIESDSEPFLRFARKTLAPYQELNFSLSRLDQRPRLRVTLHLDRMIPTEPFLHGAERVGYRAAMTDASCRSIAGRLAIESRWQDGELHVSGTLTRGATWLGRVRRVMDRSWTTSGEDYFIFFRHLVWFSLFSMLARLAQVFVIHGAALDVANRGVLMAGLSGSGKTTTSLGMVLAGKAKLVADNYVLFDGERLYPFMDWIRLRPDAERRLPERSQLGAVQLRRFGRAYYQLPPSLVGRPVEPRVVILPRLGPNPGVRQIPAETAIDSILLTTDASRELSRHQAGGLLETVIPSTESSYVGLTRSLEALVGSCRNVEVVLSPDEPVTDTMGRVLDDVL